MFTGDLLFIDGTPMMWADLGNWLAACDRILELGASVLVPGHGPVTDASGVRDVRRYLSYVREQARLRFDAGMDDAAAAEDIDISEFRAGTTRSGSPPTWSPPTASSTRRGPRRRRRSC